MMPTIPACSCAVRRSSTLLNQRRRMATAHCPTGCGYLGEREDCAPSISAKLRGKMSILPKHWPTRKLSSTVTSACRQRRGCFSMVNQRAIRIVGAIFGIALLGYLIRQAGFATLLESLHRLGWGLALIIALGGVSHLIKSYA